MPHEKIKSALLKVQAELSRAKLEADTEHDALCTDDVNAGEDPELTELLANVADEIDEYLSGSQQAGSNKHGFAHRLEEIATDFSVEHPKLDAVLLEIRKILLGIGA
ncbi:MAG: DUF4404 family protein [Gammaproteobacteria bacterium]|nr:DUF4404 family protein [Gammaproteobacteria bacterium]NNC98475.1 DUF4404 family protein [Gammaproteobacteria bacterium]NNM14782.1 DUF4404 family protein [Gammaproteobacteria bacterium]